MSTKKSISLTYFLCIFFLLLGLFVYLFYRSENTLVCKLFSTIFSDDLHQKMAVYCTSRIPLSMLCIYSIPAGLWIMSATLITFDKKVSCFNFNINLAFLPLAYGIGLEMIQALGLTNGTFDFMDVFIVTTFWSMSYIYLKQMPHQIKNRSLSPKYIVGSYLILFLADTIG